MVGHHLVSQPYSATTTAITTTAATTATTTTAATATTTATATATGFPTATPTSAAATTATGTAMPTATATATSDGSVVSASNFGPEGQKFQPWPVHACYVLRQDSFVSDFLSPARCVYVRDIILNIGGERGKGGPCN